MFDITIDEIQTVASVIMFIWIIILGSRINSIESRFKKQVELFDEVRKNILLQSELNDQVFKLVSAKKGDQ